MYPTVLHVDLASIDYVLLYRYVRTGTDCFDTLAAALRLSVAAAAGLLLLQQQQPAGWLLLAAGGACLLLELQQGPPSAPAVKQASSHIRPLRSGGRGGASS
jgi:hypothetical protein